MVDRVVSESLWHNPSPVTLFPAQAVATKSCDLHSQLWHGPMIKYSNTCGHLYIKKRQISANIMLHAKYMEYLKCIKWNSKQQAEVEI